LGRCAERLAATPGETGATLARCLAALHGRLGSIPVDQRLRRDVEGVLYPRLWKVVEALRDGLPPGEQLNRVRALDQRLHDLLDAG
jgi:hypothetical protein